MLALLSNIYRKNVSFSFLEEPLLSILGGLQTFNNGCKDKFGILQNRNDNNFSVLKLLRVLVSVVACQSRICGTH
jgi:hypothetical protein